MLNNEKTNDGTEDFKNQLRKELINKGGLRFEIIMKKF